MWRSVEGSFCRGPDVVHCILNGQWRVALAIQPYHEVVQ